MSSADIRGMFAGLPGAHGIIEAALNGQGRVMTDDSARPSSAAALAGDFLFLGGEPSEELVRRALNAENRAWIVQGSSAFLALVQAQRSGTWSERIAFEPHRQPEDAHLTALLANLPQGVTLVPIGAAEMAFCRKTPWAADFVSQFTEDESAAAFFVHGGDRIYIYPDNLNAKATLWLWQLRDLAVIGIGLLIAVLALTQLGLFLPMVLVAAYAFLSIHLDGLSVLDFLSFVVSFYLTEQQLFEWEEPA